jgi:hypothetical protein
MKIAIVANAEAIGTKKGQYARCVHNEAFVVTFALLYNAQLILVTPVL